jgi:hypothetical protein
MYTLQCLQKDSQNIPTRRSKRTGSLHYLADTLQLKRLDHDRNTCTVAPVANGASVAIIVERNARWLSQRTNLP